MKKFILFFSVIILIQLQSCNVTKGWQSYAIKEHNGRSYLKNMKFKNSFQSEMANCIDEESIYLLEREPAANITQYVILRFFKTGQWVRYISNDYPTSDLVNNLSKGVFIGYYNCKQGIITTEEPNFNFSAAGKSNIHYYQINNNFIEQLKTPFKSNPFYKKVKIDGMIPVSPDW